MFVREVIAETINKKYRCVQLTQSGHAWHEVQERLLVPGNVPVFAPRLLVARRDHALTFMEKFPD
jgi:hypothetical protein